jgi:spore maturation protein CgeB
VQEHTYSRRFERLFADAFNLAEKRKSAALSADLRSALSGLSEQHQPRLPLHLLRALLVAPLSLIFGPRRGARAARRTLFELSWRIAREKTYSAAGWPGRIFYRES